MHHLPESVRQQYLEAMGITQWYARFELPNAAVIEWPEVVADPGVSSVEPAPTSLSTNSTTGAESTPMAPSAEESAVAQAPSVDLSGGDVSTATVPAPSAPPATRAARTRGIEFVQRWWARGEWAIIDTRPRGLSDTQQRTADRLLASLAQAVCGERKPDVSHFIDWPLFVNRAIKHDMEEAQFYLGQKWRALQQQTPITRLILLGDRSEALIAPALTGEPVAAEPVASGGNEADYFAQLGAVRCLRGPGTSELLHLPNEKRELWRLLSTWLADAP